MEIKRRSFLLSMAALPVMGKFSPWLRTTQFYLKFSGCDDDWLIWLKGSECVAVHFNGNPMQQVEDKYVYNADGVMSELKFRVNSENEIVVDYVCSAHGKGAEIVSMPKRSPLWDDFFRGKT